MYSSVSFSKIWVGLCLCINFISCLQGQIIVFNYKTTYDFMEGEISLVWKERWVLSKHTVFSIKTHSIHISKDRGSHTPSATPHCSLAEKLSKVRFSYMHGAGHAAIGFQMSYERQEPVRLRSSCRHCWVLHSDQEEFWLPSSYTIRQCSIHSSVFWPCKTSPWPLLWALSPCLSLLKSFPPCLPPSSLRSSQFLTDMSCSCCLPLTISFSGLISKYASPTPLVNHLLSTFCTHCPVSWLTLPVLGLQGPTTSFLLSAPLLDFLPFPRLLVLIGSPPSFCISINFFPPTDTTHRWKENKCPEVSESPAHENCRVFFQSILIDFSLTESPSCFDRVPALSAEHVSAIKWNLT